MRKKEEEKIVLLQICFYRLKTTWLPMIWWYKHKHICQIVVITFIEIIFTDRTCVLQNVPILHSETDMEDQKFERYLVFPVDLLEVWKVNKAKQTPRLRTD